MKRDIGLIKALLEYIEDHYDGMESARPITIYEDKKLKKYVEQSNENNKGKDIGVVFHYHLNLLVEAGLVIAIEDTKKQIPHDSLLKMYYPIRLSWEGHDFVANCKNPETWERVKSVVNETKSFGFDVIKNALVACATLAVQKALGQIP